MQLSDAHAVYAVVVGMTVELMTDTFCMVNVVAFTMSRVPLPNTLVSTICTWLPPYPVSMVLLPATVLFLMMLLRVRRLAAFRPR